MHNQTSDSKSCHHTGGYSDSFDNCHRTKKNTGRNVDSDTDSKSSKAYRTDSDTDSSTSKYVVREDDRERRDGPGGN